MPPSMNSSSALRQHGQVPPLQIEVTCVVVAQYPFVDSYPVLVPRIGGFEAVPGEERRQARAQSQQQLAGGQRMERRIRAARRIEAVLAHAASQQLGQLGPLPWIKRIELASLANVCGRLVRERVHEARKLQPSTVEELEDLRHRVTAIAHVEQEVHQSGVTRPVRVSPFARLERMVLGQTLHERASKGDTLFVIRGAGHEPQRI